VREARSKLGSNGGLEPQLRQTKHVDPLSYLPFYEAFGVVECLKRFFLRRGIARQDQARSGSAAIGRDQDFRHPGAFNPGIR